jgi:hypothetical protein
MREISGMKLPVVSAKQERIALPEIAFTVICFAGVSVTPYRRQPVISCHLSPSSILLTKLFGTRLYSCPRKKIDNQNTE